MALTEILITQRNKKKVHHFLLNIALCALAPLHLGEFYDQTYPHSSTQKNIKTTLHVQIQIIRRLFSL